MSWYEHCLCRHVMCGDRISAHAIPPGERLHGANRVPTGPDKGCAGPAACSVAGPDAEIAFAPRIPRAACITPDASKALVGFDAERLARDLSQQVPGREAALGSSAAIAARQVDVHRLQADSSGPGEAIPEQLAGAGE